MKNYKFFIVNEAKWTTCTFCDSNSDAICDICRGCPACCACNA